MRRFVICIAVLLGLISAAVAKAPATVSGRVVDVTGAKIAGADVTVEQAGMIIGHVTTDANGIFTLATSDGNYRVIVLAPGFKRSQTDNVHLAGAIIRLDVSAPASGFPVTPAPIMPMDTQASAPLTQQVVDPPPTAILDHTPWNYGALVQGGVGVTEDRSSFGFLMAGAHVGKVLTDPIGHGSLRGNFEYAVEAFPFWQSYTPTFLRNQCVAIAAPAGAIQCSAPYTVGGTFTGVSVTPIILRWNLIGARRISFWGQAAGGLLWTNHKYPAFGGPAVLPGVISAGNIAGILQNNGPSADASVWNFTPQGGIGMHWFYRAHRSIDLGANAVHISSASLGDRNPGVNASVQFTLGTSWWK